MGYHVSIINLSDCPDKKLSNPNEVANILNTFYLQPKLDHNGKIEFYYKENEDFAIFYSNNSLWVINPDESVLKLLIDISLYLNDGSIVIGDEGEIYLTPSEFYFNEDNLLLIDTKSKILQFLKSKILFIIPILLGVIKWLIDK